MFPRSFFQVFVLFCADDRWNVEEIISALNNKSNTESLEQKKLSS